LSKADIEWERPKPAAVPSEGAFPVEPGGSLRLCIFMAINPSDATVDVMLDARATIGESPLWAAAENALYWMDIKKPALHRFDPRTGAVREWGLTSDIGGFALLENCDAAVVALRQGLYRLEFSSGALIQLATAPFDTALFRFNEGACDVNGRFWIGVMCDPTSGKTSHEKGSLHSFKLSSGLRREDDLSDLHNGMAWNADSTSFYLSHSNEQDIFRFPYDSTSGRLGEKRLFASLPGSLGIPDGAAVDSEGGYWCACHGGGRLRRFGPDGKYDRDILLPVSQPTMCAFGGNDLDELYITSARDQLSAEQLEQEPLAGGLLRVRPGIHGIRRYCFVQ
jgi:sugar lactone lactonase YvrE